MGACGSLSFSTGIVTDTTSFQIQATNVNSNCSILLDSTITLFPSGSQIAHTENINLCSGDSILIDNQYIYTSGTYQEVFAISSFCDSVVTYNISISQSSLTTDLGADFEICNSESVDLQSNYPNLNNLWSDGSTSSSITINLPGTYWLEVSDTCGNSSTDTVLVTSNNIAVNIGSDIVLCEGDSLVLNTNIDNANHEWQDGSSGSSYTVVTEGVYYVDVNRNNCLASDTIKVDYQSAPIFDLGPDSIICFGEETTLSTKKPFYDHIWSTGSSTPTIIVNNAGTYSVTVSNECGQYSDELSISTKNCDCVFYVPNSFTPDDNQFNQEFKPIIDCELEEYNLLIFNRWGEIMFESNSIFTGWDGVYYRSKVKSGVYPYKIIYKISGEEKKEIIGHVTVIY
jgi:gliding motility-associated-like protein